MVLPSAHKNCIKHSWSLCTVGGVECNGTLKTVCCQKWSQWFYFTLNHKTIFSQPKMSRQPSCKYDFFFLRKRFIA